MPKKGLRFVGIWWKNINYMGLKSKTKVPHLLEVPCYSIDTNTQGYLIYKKKTRVYLCFALDNQPKF